MEAVKFNSLGQISHVLYDVVGEYVKFVPIELFHKGKKDEAG